MKQKKRTETEQLNKVRISLFSVSLLTLFMLIFISCNNEKKNNDKKGEIKEAALTNPTKWPVFKLDGTTILAIAELKGNRNRSIILKHMFLGLTDDGRVVMKLNGTASLTHGAGGNGGHGRNRRFSFMLDTAGYRPLEDTINIGNNYINWRVIADAIFVERSGEANEHTTLIPDFGYILFTPKNTYEPSQHPNRPMVKGHLWYDLTYHKPNGDFLFPDGKPLGGGGAGSSNPSPPADPTP